jgi:putative Co-chaperone protein hscB-like protein
MENIRDRRLKMIYRYQIDVKIKEGSTERTIKKSIFRKRILTDEEQEEAQLEFIRNTKALYKEKGIDLEVLEWGIQEFELVRKNS